MTRQIVLDTETTGISPQAGHRIIEIGCVELIQRQLTGQHYHVYLNPDRDIEEAAFRVHGISSDFLKDKPRFSDIADDFLAFIQDAELIIHNAAFDVGFLNAELARINPKFKLEQYSTVFDTLLFAREKHRGARNNLDALCKRYHIENTHRTLHGALLDAEILAHVYLAMTGGQIELFTSPETPKTHESSTTQAISNSESVIESLSPVIHASDDELQRHQKFVKLLIEKSAINRWEDL